MIDCLLSILLRAEKYRIITLELNLLILKELVYSETKQSKLTEQQKETLEVCFSFDLKNQ